MPYIPKELRPALDKTIEELACKITDACNDPQKPWIEAAGLLNYCITRLIMLLLPLNMKYWQIALMTGVIENVKQELYRKVAGPFEDSKCLQNGEVYDN